MKTSRIVLSCALAMLVCSAGADSVYAQRKESPPKELEGVGLTEDYDAQVPLDLPFVDSQQGKLTLGELFDGSRPVILTMNYSNCPKLCSLQLNALVDTIKAMDWNLGQEYRVVTIGLDPLETSQRAQLTRQSYLKAYGRPGSADGWRFLTSRNEKDIKQVAETVGFHYRKIPGTNDYAHVAALMICTPDGRVSQYLTGIEYDPQTLRLSMVEASEGRVGSAMDQILLYCFHYDAQKGRYGPAAYKLMRIGGVLTVMIFGAVLSVYWIRERRRVRVGQGAGQE